MVDAADVKKKDPEQFEFTDVHNISFSGLATWMKLAGAVFFGLAAAFALFALLTGRVYNTFYALLGVVAAVLATLMGLWTMRSSNKVGLIVKTEGDDLAHLMDAIQELKKLFTVQVVLFAAGIVLFLIGMLRADLSPK